MHQQDNRPGEHATRAPEVTYRGTLAEMFFAISLGWRPLGTIFSAASVDDAWAVYENASETGASALKPGLLRVVDACSATLHIAPHPASPTLSCELRRPGRAAGDGLRKVAALWFVIGVAAGFFLTCLTEKQGWARSIAVAQRTPASTPERNALLASKVSRPQASPESSEDSADGGGHSPVSRMASPHSAASYLIM
jgi:hypothetical protein